MEATNCSVRMCQQPAEGPSPSTCQPLCSQHLEVDVQRYEKYEASVRQKIEELNRFKPAVQKLQQRLSSDLQLLQDNFEDLREALDKCQKELTDKITKHHENIFYSMTAFSEMEELKNDLSKAKKSKDMRQAFLISNDIERCLETIEVDSKLIHWDESAEQVRMVAYPDVNARIKSIANAIEIQQEITLQILDNLDVLSAANSTESSDNLPLPELTVDSCFKARSNAACVAVCDNTNGYALDKSGRIVRGQAIDGVRELPEPTVIFVDINTTKVAVALDESKHRALFDAVLISADNELFGQSSLSLDNSSSIVDIQWDSRRQLLFVAQRNLVTATDLCGVALWTVNYPKICCLTGNSDKLFVAVKSASVFAISKDSGEEQSQLQLDFLDNLTQSSLINVHDFMLTVYHDSKLYKVCIITEMLIEEQPEDRHCAYGCDTSNLRENDSAILSLASFGEFTWGLRIPIFGEAPLVQHLQAADWETSMKNLRLVLAESSKHRKVFFSSGGARGPQCYTLRVK
ncbi:hypothetical protein BOX15_Mlig014486g2 [Macrostomum lignano]|uniref:Uncharacterized protein n=1 Tax=Macrostomum lignano TaxID=282301 RepID=A0A267DRX5_9PLAT|nr:hypothetical protein BOX15_Mlig014486g2 [Macrostomum lignano]